jgi:uncharacterized protein YdhG (YjbR/CyaY superfamily)
VSDKSDATKTIDAYVAGLEPPFREAIAHLRQIIRAAAPEASEVITYKMPGIALRGPLIAYSAFKRHCSIFPMGTSVIAGMADELAPWRSTPGTIQFASDAPLPDKLILQIVRTRIAENIAKIGRKSKRKAPNDIVS